MTHEQTVEHTILRDLGDGLILRRSTPADAETLATFNSRIHSDRGPEQPDLFVEAWTRDLLAGNHPTFAVDDFTVVEDTRTGAIVSSLNLIPQTWTYAGLAFDVGRIELVGTHPDYRNRGLVRTQFEVAHRWSAERGHWVQAITGIPWYYRQFGYEMALELGGGRFGYAPQIPKLKDDETEAYHLRPATEADLPFIMQLCRQAERHSLIACPYGEALWRYEMFGRSEKNVHRREQRIVESAAGESIGLVEHAAWLWGTGLTVTRYELAPGVSWLAVTPAVIRYLQATGQAYAERDGRTFDSFGFGLGSDHPVYHAWGDRLPDKRNPYAWYLRVADVPGFLRHLTPVLEQRLAESVLVGHTGELKISFYRNGVRLVIERGRLTGIEAWRPTPKEWGAAAFPDLTFLQLLFGYRSLSELRYAFADCWADVDQARALLETLFPKQTSRVLPVD